jgi:preprotein translocase subunit YajC
MIGASGGGGGAGFFILIIIAFAFLWFVLVRPQKRRQTAQRQMLDELKVGDEVLTAGGIYGEITALGDDDVIVRIAPQLEVRVARRAIGGVVTPPEPEAEEAPAEVEESVAEPPREE